MFQKFALSKNKFIIGISLAHNNLNIQVPKKFSSTWKSSDLTKARLSMFKNIFRTDFWNLKEKVLNKQSLVFKVQIIK